MDIDLELLDFEPRREFFLQLAVASAICSSFDYTGDVIPKISNPLGKLRAPGTFQDFFCRMRECGTHSRTEFSSARYVWEEVAFKSLATLDQIQESLPL